MITWPLVAVDGVRLAQVLAVVARFEHLVVQEQQQRRGHHRQRHHRHQDRADLPA
jgi:hypothetical protein